jgi:hypothetical protein
MEPESSYLVHKNLLLDSILSQPSLGCIFHIVYNLRMFGIDEMNKT